MAPRQKVGTNSSPKPALDDDAPVGNIPPAYSTLDLVSDDPDADPWNAPELIDNGVKWSELDTKGKMMRVLTGLLKLVALLGLLYFFICSLDVLSSAFQLVGGKAAGDIFKDNAVLANPVAGLVIGVLVTVMVQSSSTSSSIVVSMVSSGPAGCPVCSADHHGSQHWNFCHQHYRSYDAGRRSKRVPQGVCRCHGARFLQLARCADSPPAGGSYRRPVQTHPPHHRILQHPGRRGRPRPAQRHHRPFFTDSIVQLDKNVISLIATNDEAAVNMSLIKEWCKTKTNVTFWNATVENCTAGALCWEEGNLTWTMLNKTWIINQERCKHIFANTTLPDLAVGLILLALSLFVLCTCLILIVKLLNSMLKGQVAVVIKRVINTDFPFPFCWVTGYIAIFVGAGMTFIVQSSSVFTSAIYPLVGIGVISLERAYPLTLGSNIGTTTTAILAAMASPAEKLKESLQIALCHFFFNVMGFLLFYPIPFTRVPIRLARGLGNHTAKYRWFAGLYLVLCFLVFPLTVFGLSMAGWQVLVGVGVPFVVLIVFVIVVNVMQSRCPRFLPKVLQDWDFLPRPLHSMAPWDTVVTSALGFCGKYCCCCCKCCKKTEDENMMKNNTKSLEMYDNPSMLKDEDTKEASKATHL
nr:Na/P cotransport protein NaPi-II [Pseudopleuronectes americanus]